MKKSEQGSNRVLSEGAEEPVTGSDGLGSNSPEWHEFVGNSPEITALRELATRAAATSSTVLIQGETGTGKGVVARRIHRLSDRRDLPFVHVDCAALSPTLIESELFGHERGAFTGAAVQRRGRFETAANGTIFLDEIGDLGKDLQSKLLRVLEDRRFERVGGTQSIAMNARVIAATSHDLRSAVARGRFRRDLYFRLNVVEVAIPPLRERLDDLRVLVDAALRRVSVRVGVSKPEVPVEFVEQLSDYTWPGNVRELFNVLERMLVQHPTNRLDGSGLDHLFADASCHDEQRPQAESAPQRPHFENEDAEVIAAAIRDTGGNLARAARRLGIPRGTLRYRIKKHRLQEFVPRD